MELKDIMKIEKEGTIKDQSKETRLEGGLTLKRTGESLIKRSIPWFESLEDDMSVGEQLALDMGGTIYKAKKKESSSHKRKSTVSEATVIELLKDKGLTQYLKEAVNTNKLYKDYDSGVLTDTDVRDCFERLVEEKLDINILDLLVETNLVKSKSEARRLIEQNGISLNQEKITSVEKIITEKDLNDNSIIIQKGKKVFLKVIFK